MSNENKNELRQPEGLGAETCSLVPSRRYTCRDCGAKGRRGNKLEDRMKDPICPSCVKLRSKAAMCSSLGAGDWWCEELLENRIGRCKACIDFSENAKAHP